MTDKERLIEGKALIDNLQFGESINKLLSIPNNGKSAKFLELKNLFMGNSYYNIGEYFMAIQMLEKVIKSNNKNELASQLKYLCLVHLKKYNLALIEIMGFLKRNPADLYKATLEELLHEIKIGNITDADIIDGIHFLAIENNVI